MYAKKMKLLNNDDQRPSVAKQSKRILWKLLHKNPTEAVSEDRISSLFAEAYNETASVGGAVEGLVCSFSLTKRCRSWQKVLRRAPSSVSTVAQSNDVTSQTKISSRTSAQKKNHNKDNLPNFCLRLWRQCCQSRNNETICEFCSRYQSRIVAGFVANLIQWIGCWCFRGKKCLFVRKTCLIEIVPFAVKFRSIFLYLKVFVEHIFAFWKTLT